MYLGKPNCKNKPHLNYKRSYTSTAPSRKDSQMGGKQDSEKGWMIKELRRLFFTLKPWQEIHPEQFESYLAALGEVYPPEMTALVNRAVKTHWPELNWCSAKELSDLLRDMRAAARAELTPTAKDECPGCRGTGWKIVIIDGAQKAAVCDCRVPYLTLDTGPQAARIEEQRYIGFSKHKARS